MAEKDKGRVIEFKRKPKAELIRYSSSRAVTSNEIIATMAAFSSAVLRVPGVKARAKELMFDSQPRTP